MARPSLTFIKVLATTSKGKACYQIISKDSTSLPLSITSTNPIDLFNYMNELNDWIPCGIESNQGSVKKYYFYREEETE